MIQCIIVDDEPLATKLLGNYVDRHEQLTLAATFHDPIEALHSIREVAVDLIFLDIQMPQLTGIQFLKILDNKCPAILTTAYEEYALESYDYKVIDYLVKPISYDRFSKSIIKYQQLIIKDSAVKEPAERVTAETNSLFIKSGLKIIRVDMNDITHMESKGDYLHVYCGDAMHKTLENLKDILPRLSNTFLRCHRSFIVNTTHILFIENSRIVIGDHYIPISRTHQKEVLGRFG